MPRLDASPPPLSPLTSAGSELEREIVLLEGARCRALLAGDLAALELLCAEDLIYTHTSTRRDTKASWLQHIGSGFYRYLALEQVDYQVRQGGDTALVTGYLRTDVTVDGMHKQLDNVILLVWVRRAHRWQFIAYQPTPIPSGTAANTPSPGLPHCET